MSENDNRSEIKAESNLESKEDLKPKQKDESKTSFVPLDKQSKSRKKEFHDAKRGSWGNVNPVTRTPPNPKAYNRRKTGR